MSDPIRALESLRQQFEQDLASAGTEADLRSLRDKYLSRKGGLVSAWLKSLGSAPADQRPRLGQLANATKAHIEGILAERIEAAAQARPPKGAVDVTLIHTPGHTPGSQCFFVDGRLVSGDTLFLDGCGRTDLPGGDPAALYDSLTQRLAQVPDDAVLYPGHLYSPAPNAPLGEVRQHNYVFRPRTREQWMMMFGHDG